MEKISNFIFLFVVLSSVIAFFLVCMCLYVRALAFSHLCRFLAVVHMFVSAVTPALLKANVYLYTFFSVFFFISISCIIDWAVFFCYCWWWWYHTSNQMIANIQYTCFCSFHKQFFLLNFHIYERWQQYRYTLWAQTLLPSGVKLLFLLYHFNSIYIFSFIYAKYRRIQNGIWIGFSSSPSTICLNTYIELMLKALLQQ